MAPGYTRAAIASSLAALGITGTSPTWAPPTRISLNLYDWLSDLGKPMNLVLDFKVEVLRFWRWRVVLTIG